MQSTLQHVKDGTINIERLDDAVRRILRVKLLSGIFQKGAPSTRANAGNENLLALPEHRVVARQAVRESLVLLKNNNQLLPIDPSKTILVVGDGALVFLKQVEVGHFLGKEQVTVMINFQMENLFYKVLNK